MERVKLARIEKYIFDFFRTRQTDRLLAAELFEISSEYANADLVRAFEDLEKRWRLLIRYTLEGNDWIQLTPDGARYVGLHDKDISRLPEVHPHPPRSATFS
jgi:hypothetical protein